MKKAFMVLSLIAITVLLFSMYYIKSNQKGDIAEKALVKAFDSSGAKVVNSEVYIYGKLGEKYGDLEELKKLTDMVSNSLRIVKDSTYSKITTKNDSMIKVELKGRNASKNIIDINAEVSKQVDSSLERFISISVMVDLSNKGLEEIREKVAGILGTFGVQSKVNSCIVGNFEGKLNNQQMNDVCLRMFNETEAEKVEGMKDKSLISVSAYSPLIDDSIRVNGKKVNLNLAIRYNSYEDKTYIWLATPVITTEY